MKSKLSIGALMVAAGFAVCTAPAQAALDKEAIMDILDTNDCLKCHDMTQAKKGPSYKKIAAKYKGKADAKQKLLDNVTKQPIVTLDDGTKEKHKKIDVKDPAELDAIFTFILSR